MTKEEIRLLIQQVRPYFRSRLGKTTHKRVSEHWYFHSLGFVRDTMTYVFGINMGFFVQDNADGYQYAGLSITIRANGENPEVRKSYLDFFSSRLKKWSNRPYERYTSDRGGEGLLITRYTPLSSTSPEGIVAFMKEAIDEFHPIYQEIINESSTFSKVVKAEAPWDESIIEVAEAHL